VNYQLRNTQVDEHITLQFETQDNYNCEIKDGAHEDMEEEE
jgi:hypothetical protein